MQLNPNVANRRRTGGVSPPWYCGSIFQGAAKLHSIVKCPSNIRAIPNGPVESVPKMCWRAVLTFTNSVSGAARTACGRHLTNSRRWICCRARAGGDHVEGGGGNDRAGVKLMCKLHSTLAFNFSFSAVIIGRPRDCSACISHFGFN